MNFVIFPLFFLSSALYPLWKMQEASLWLYWICVLNPFSHGVELVRYALYLQFNPVALMVCAATTAICLCAAVLTFSPKRTSLRTAPSK